MDVSLFIAGRIKFKGKMAMVSIAISFFIMILSVSISSGFRKEIRDGISSISGDIQLLPVDLNYLNEASPINRNPGYLTYIKGLDGVKSVSAAVYKAGIVKGGDNIHGVVFKGVEGMSSSSEGLRVSVPSRLAAMLGLAPGDGMPAYFVGEQVKVRKFTVDSIYDSVINDGDNLVVYADMADLQRLNGWNEDQVSVLEISLEDKMRNVRNMEEMEREAGSIALLYASDDDVSVVSVSAVSRFPQLFDWLGLIDFNVVFILILMTIVAGFNMISGLLIMLFENISTIGLLKAIGMTDRSIAKIFLASSSALVLKGMLIGNGLALLFCLIQSKTGILKLDPSNYFISFVPVDPDIPAILAADAAAWLLIMLLLLIPSLFISRVDPAQTVRLK